MSDHDAEKDRKVVQFKPRRQLLRPTPLLPESADPFEQRLNSPPEAPRRATQNNIHERLREESPDVTAARKALEEAQANLEKITIREAHLKLAEGLSELDIHNVEQLCEDEPWKKGRLAEIATSNFGFVPEKFEAMANQHPEGSEAHQKFMEACMKAREIYWDQIKRDVKRTFHSVAKTSTGAVQTRAHCEQINEALRAGYKKFEGNKIYGHQYGRLLWAAEALGRTCMENGGNSRRDGYQKFRLSLSMSGGVQIDGPDHDLEP